MSELHANITLTFRTAASASVVLEDILAAMRRHSMPYELASAFCSSFDLDEVDDGP